MISRVIFNLLAVIVLLCITSFWTGEKDPRLLSDVAFEMAATQMKSTGVVARLTSALVQADWSDSTKDVEIILQILDLLDI